MKIDHHQAYKDSGIEWIGEVPEHWRLCKLKDIAFYQEGPGIMGDDFKETGIPLIRISGMKGSTVSLEGCNYLDPIKVTKKWSHFQLKQGNLLVSASATTGVVAKVNEDTFGAIPYTGLIRFKPRQGMAIDYLRYLLISDVFTNQIDLQKSGTTIQHYGPTHLGRVFAILPPLSEQKAIAHYLDTKTAQIDRKIDILTQKATQYGNLKQSLINEAVTRGLDRSVVMKDSGIEWIGKVPKHWEIKRVKEIFDISRGRVIAQPELIEDGYYPVYSSQTKDNGCLGYINTFDYEGEYITWTTDGAYAGTVFLRRGQFNCTNICGTLKIKIRNQSINYLFYSLQVSTKHNKRIDTNGAKIMSNEMSFIKIATPPLSEQKAIADYLDTKTAQIDQIIQTISTQIEKLKELRKTLINDVVTGKIKVV